MFEPVDRAMQNYLPNQHKKIEEKRTALTREYVQKYRKGDTLNNFEQKYVLQTLKKKGLIEPDQEHRSLEKSFFFMNMLGVCLGTVSLLFPYLVREFHSASKTKRYGIWVSLFASIYGVTITPSYLNLRNKNREILQKNLHKLYE